VTVPGSQHAARARPTALVWVAAVLGGVLIGGSATAASLAMTTPERPRSTAVVQPPPPATVVSLPRPMVSAAPAAESLCALPAVQAALAAGDDAAVIAASGGAMRFRSAIAGGAAPCISLADPGRIWVVINKQRPCDPIDYQPAGIAVPASTRTLGETALRGDAAAALAAMISAAAGSGAGEVALDSGFRSFATQRTTYATQVGARGRAGAELISARPGFSEHQTGLAADVVACSNGGCGSIEQFAATPQGAWVAEHAWEYGWVVRYHDGQTPITGYQPEPWHLRYLGPDLARAYHDGGFRTLEEFFALPPAPDYAG